MDHFWPDIDLDLSEAHLHQLELTHCHIRNVQFSGAQFGELALFNGAQFGGVASFDGAQFDGFAWFIGAQFNGGTMFSQAQFDGDAWFNEAQFGGFAVFRETKFGGRDARFNGARFSGITGFIRAQFSGDAAFDGARARPHHHSWPTGWTTRDARTAEGEEEGWLYVVHDEDSNEHPTDVAGDGEDRSDSEAGTSGT